MVPTSPKAFCRLEFEISRAIMRITGLVTTIGVWSTIMV